MNNRKDAKERDFNRLSICQHDFDEANEFAGKLLEEYQKESQDHCINMALSTALIISYSRPFTSAEPYTGVTGFLGSFFLDKLSGDERKLHDRIKEMRDKEVAHSDPISYMPNVSVNKINGQIIAVGISRKPTPHPKEDVIRLLKISERHIRTATERCINIQAELEPEQSFNAGTPINEKKR